VTVLSGRAATETAVKQAIEGRRVFKTYFLSRDQ
jgi:hypothetical protein